MKYVPFPKDKLLGYRAWEKALGLLGGAGWELVSVQHGNRFNENTWQDNGLIDGDKVAYLKRLVVSGRGVDEPQLNLELLLEAG